MFAYLREEFAFRSIAGARRSITAATAAAGVVHAWQVNGGTGAVSVLLRCCCCCWCYCSRCLLCLHVFQFPGWNGLRSWCATACSTSSAIRRRSGSRGSSSATACGTTTTTASRSCCSSFACCSRCLQREFPGWHFRCRLLLLLLLLRLSKSSGGWSQWYQ